MGTISAVYFTLVVSHPPAPLLADKTSSLCLEHPATPSIIVAKQMDPAKIIFFILMSYCSFFLNDCRLFDDTINQAYICQKTCASPLYGDGRTFWRKVDLWMPGHQEAAVDGCFRIPCVELYPASPIDYLPAPTSSLSFHHIPLTFL